MAERLVQLPTLSVSVTNAQERKLRELWNKRVSDPFAFTPNEEREKGVSLEQSIEKNTKLGQFGADYLKQGIQVIRPYLRQTVVRKKVVACGLGRGYDLNWLEEAILATFRPVCVDVSDVACDMARPGIEAQLARLRANGAIWLPGAQEVIKRAEIRAALAEPEDLLGLRKAGEVAIWYFCRFINCLFRQTAKVVLQNAGQSLSLNSDPEKAHQIIFVGALREDNPDVAGKTSVMPTQRMLLINIGRGAGRPVKAFYKCQTRFFSKIVTAMTIKAA